ncbi:MAG: M23 family metallopeptidase [Spirochaetaceae bacterium]|jgi:hypothetical protein|nr:M23 family metallopeptidase [Spirochaetaceae bacterium]
MMQKPVQTQGRIVPVLLVFLNVVLPGACQSTQGPSEAGEFKAAVVGTLKPGEPFVVAVAAGQARPGQSPVVNAGLAGQAGTDAAGSGAAEPRMRAVLFRGETQLGRAQFFDLGELSRRGPVWTAAMAVPSTVGAGAAQLRVEQNGRTLAVLDVVIEERQFLTETFPITGAMVNILAPDPEKTRQAEQLWAILARTGNDIYTLGEFIMPVKSTVQTSRFGSRRVYRYPNGRTSTSIHAGVDWRAPTGTPISACAPGRVVMARSRIVTGNTVVIEHMPGVYSLYYHMDRIDVAEGDMVQTGTRLGDAGATGFATGAHLHWELRVATENTDPASLLGRKLLDKDAILRILNE